MNCDCLLVARCTASDGAKVTLAELLHHFHSGSLPSLSHLAEIRRVSRSTVQLHLHELVSKGILEKEPGEKSNSSIYTFSRDGLLSDIGIDGSFDPGTWLKSFGGSTDKDVTRTECKSPEAWTCEDAMRYFRRLEERKYGRKRAGSRALFRRLLRLYGGVLLKKMVLHFFQVHTLMRERFTEDALRDKAGKIAVYSRKKRRTLE